MLTSRSSSSRPLSVIIYQVSYYSGGSNNAGSTKHSKIFILAWTATYSERT
jgi:hypothetical protein